MGAKYPASVFPDIQYVYDGSIAIDVGDLMYHDANDAKPASSQADQGTEILNQRTFARRFAGVATERHLVADAAGTISVAPLWIGDVTCVSDTYEEGDLLTVDEAASGIVLLDQTVVKTTDPDLAIGWVMKREASATTTLRACLVSRTTPLAGIPAPGIAKLDSQSLEIAAFTDNTDTTGYIDFTTTLPAGALVLGWKAVVSVGFAGDTTAVMQVGVAGDLDDFTADTTQSCLAAGTVGSAAQANDAAYNNAAVTPRVTVTGGADFTSIVTAAGGTMVVTIYYIPCQP